MTDTFDGNGGRLSDLGEQRQRRLTYTAIVANTLILLVLLFAVFNERTPTVYWLFPVVWITVGVWGLLYSRRPAADRRTRRVAGAIAVGYFGLLAVAGGIVGPSGAVETGLTIQLSDLPPGWNPAILYSGEMLQLAVVPYTTFGYAVLAYLVYLTAIEARGAVAGGLLGLFSCVSCTLPIIASIVGGFVGGGAALAAAASVQSYALGTAVFVATVVLLTVRPGFGRLRQRL